MKTLRKLFVATIFASLLTVSVCAGDMSAGVTSPPPTPTPETNGDMSAGFTDAALTLLEGVLSTF